VNAPEELNNLEKVLDRLDQVGQGQERVSLEAIVDIVGDRSFGPVLLVLGLIPLSPLSGIPGVSTAIAVMVLLVAGQLLLGRSCCWLPRWLVRRSVPRAKLERSLRLMRPLARFVDKLLRPRLTALTGSAATYTIAALCIIIALIMPLLEVIPFANTTAGAALTAFGLALIAKDGLLVLISVLFCGASLMLILRPVFC
jgi:hypothetical protein